MQTTIRLVSVTLFCVMLLACVATPRHTSASLQSTNNPLSLFITPLFDPVLVINEAEVFTLPLNNAKILLGF